MAFASDPATSPQFKFFELLYREAFARLGYEFDYQVLPMKRCSVMANAGKVDGEPQRIGNYAVTYDNLIRVEEPVFVTKVYAFARDPAIIITNWDSLTHTHYYVDYVIGALQTEQALLDRVPAPYLTGIKSVKQGLNRLNAGRSDIFIDLEVRAQPLLQSRAFKTSGIVIVGTLSSHHSYPFLHKRHRELAPKLAATLKQLKSEGVYQQILHETLPFIEL